MRWLIDLFFADDEPPERMGPIGFAILAIFGLFCLFAWFHHSAR